MSETYTVLFQNKFEKQCILLAFITRRYITMHGPTWEKQKVKPFTDEAQTALFKDPVRTAL
jgi:hypothetical protein